MSDANIIVVLIVNVVCVALFSFLKIEIGVPIGSISACLLILLFNAWDSKMVKKK